MANVPVPATAAEETVFTDTYEESKLTRTDIAHEIISAGGESLDEADAVNGTENGAEVAFEESDLIRPGLDSDGLSQAEKPSLPASLIRNSVTVFVEGKPYALEKVAGAEHDGLIRGSFAQAQRSGEVQQTFDGGEVIVTGSPSIQDEEEEKTVTVYMTDPSSMHASEQKTLGTSEDGAPETLMLSADDGHEVVSVQPATNELIVTTTPVTGGEKNVTVYVPEGAYGYLPNSVTNDGSMCTVCGDRGSGYHYSSFSCEGCKGFFKRSVQKNLTYTCRNRGACDINKFTRNSCQYCRFKKCIEMGMKKEGVREDRTPGGNKKTIGVNLCGMNSAKRARVSDVEDVALVTMKMSLQESQADSLLEKLMGTDPLACPTIVSLIQTSTIPDLTPAVISSESFLTFMYDELQSVIRWARMVPGISDVDISDQMALLKCSFVELMLFRLAHRSVGVSEECLKFCDGLVLGESDTTQLGFPSEVFESVQDLTQKLRLITLDDKEASLINAIILTNSDGVGISDRELVCGIQQKYLDVLLRHHSQAYADDLRRYGRILLRLIPVRALCAKVGAIYTLYIEGSGTAGEPPLPPLVADMLASE